MGLGPENSAERPVRAVSRGIAARPNRRRMARPAIASWHERAFGPNRIFGMGCLRRPRTARERHRDLFRTRNLFDRGGRTLHRYDVRVGPAAAAPYSRYAAEGIPPAFPLCRSCRD